MPGDQTPRRGPRSRADAFRSGARGNIPASRDFAAPTAINRIGPGSSPPQRSAPGPHRRTLLQKCLHALAALWVAKCLRELLKFV